MKNNAQDLVENRETDTTLPPTDPVREINGQGSGEQVKDVIPDDEESVGKELFENGMTEATVSPMADDQRRK